jgi:2-iminoacetate synthase ThiH
MEESISRMAGSYHGVKLDPEDLIAAAHRAGRPAAERTTLYEIRRRYDVPGRMSPGARVVSEPGWRARAVRTA